MSIIGAVTVIVFSGNPSFWPFSAFHSYFSAFSFLNERVSNLLQNSIKNRYLQLSIYIEVLCPRVDQRVKCGILVGFMVLLEKNM